MRKQKQPGINLESFTCLYNVNVSEEIYEGNLRI